ncbi:hypothetical protein CDD83_7884 [Cordyceps sp. RAO-2017]|nr:hypothetical protein CDD83_7884 [Cordyceps sp. RAO-2017]
MGSPSRPPTPEAARRLRRSTSERPALVSPVLFTPGQVLTYVAISGTHACGGYASANPSRPRSIQPSARETARSRLPWPAPSPAAPDASSSGASARPRQRKDDSLEDGSAAKTGAEESGRDRQKKRTIKQSAGMALAGATRPPSPTDPRSSSERDGRPFSSPCRTTHPPPVRCLTPAGRLSSGGGRVRFRMRIKHGEPQASSSPRIAQSAAALGSPPILSLAASRSVCPSPTLEASEARADDND